jgi:hypothetical protein
MWLCTVHTADQAVTTRALDPHDELDLRVGNAHRVARNRFDDALLGFLPYTAFDSLMHDLCQVGGSDWDLERRKWYSQHLHEEYR